MKAPPSLSDRIIGVIDESLRACTAPSPAARPSPGTDMAEPELAAADQRRSIALMRVNHAGEVSAQALYMGQSLAARSAGTHKHLLTAAREERDHLAWCAERVEQLGGHTSLLGAFWFTGSLAIGTAAGLFGDAKSLGFVAETERQVEAHLDDHLRRLPTADTKSTAILRKMAEDEARHGSDAQHAGGVPLPAPARGLMQATGNILRRIAYFV